MSLQFILKQGKPAAFSLCDRNYITALNFSGFCRSSFSLSIDLLIANASALRRKKRTPWKKYQFILGEILIISYLMSVSFRSLFSRLIRIRVFLKKLQKKFYQKSMVKLQDHWKTRKHDSTLFKTLFAFCHKPWELFQKF